MLEAKQQMSALATLECALNAEIDTIVGALGGTPYIHCIHSSLKFEIDDEGAQQPHSFKGSSFSIPTPCGYCKVSLGAFILGMLMLSIHSSRLYGD
jgi:hypothetical protein